MFIPFDNDPYPLGKGGGYMGSNYPASAWPADGGIDSHPFAGFQASSKLRSVVDIQKLVSNFSSNYAGPNERPEKLGMWHKA